MNRKERIEKILNMKGYPRFNLALLPTPMHELKNFGKLLGGPELWIKRDDLTGLVGGGNKTRKLEFLVGEAIEKGYDTLVTIGAIQSNHTRQTAAAAAKSGLKCALLHYGWTKDAGPNYRKVGNILLSSIMGADLYVDDKERPIEDQGPLEEFGKYLEKKGQKPYLITGGASENKFGCLGYMICAAEIVKQCEEKKISFDYLIHCTGSSSTQAGMVAGFKVLGSGIHVIGVADDGETDIKRHRVCELANNTLEMLGYDERVNIEEIEIIASSDNDYGEPGQDIYDVITTFSRSEGIVIDPVYEGRSVKGLLTLNEIGRFEKDSKVLLMHLGGTPAVHAYANNFKPVDLKPISLD
jgi:1-aminocyclopropane-1-carboxylate deaminase